MYEDYDGRKKGVFQRDVKGATGGCFIFHSFFNSNRSSEFAIDVGA